MLKVLRRKLNRKRKKEKPLQRGIDTNASPKEDMLQSDLSYNIEVLQKLYTNCSDVVFRPFQINGATQAILIHIDGMSNQEEIDRHVLKPLMEIDDKSNHIQLKDYIQQKIAVTKVNEVFTISDVIEQVSSGSTIVLIDHEACGLSIGLAKWEKRAVEEPTAESVIRGPREGFTESIGVSTSLLRRRIKSPDLKMQTVYVGGYTKTKVIVAYIQEIADPSLIEEVLNRIKRIEMDGILESGYIEELIEDHSFSPFPQVLNTERPDAAAAHLLEGRVAILVDGTPFVLIAPMTLYSLLQSSEDYYQRFLIGTCIRWLRYAFFVFSLVLPSLYIAILTYHQEMIPTTLLLSIARSREQIPFPAFVEALIMEISFEALREAGVRLPKQVGSAVSIVGALVIGQAATSAGLVSAPMVMVVASTGIASFAIPHYTLGIALRMLRFPLMFLAGTLGLLGIMLGLITIIVHLSTLRSFGVPYLSPMGPMVPREMKDVLLRAPWWSLKTRPHFTGKYNKYRQSLDNKPKPDKGGE